MRRYLILGLGLLALAVLVFFCIQHHAPQIEEDLRGRTIHALGDRGLSFVGITVDGRDVTLAGTSPSLMARDEAIAVVTSLSGVRVVHDRLVMPHGEATSVDPVSDPPPYRLHFKYTNQALIIDGNMPNDQHRDQLLQSAQQILPETAIESNINLRPAAPSDWSSAATAMIAGLAMMETGQATLEAESFSLQGSVADANQGYELKQTVSRLIPATYRSSYALDLDLSEEGLACQRQFTLLLKGKSIQFALNKTNILNTSYPLLNELASAAKTCPNVEILITGHTDSNGGEEVNQIISKARAQAVVNYLQAQGVPVDRLSAEGYGESRPLADNGTTEGRELNRRVEFVVREPKP